MKKTSSVPQFIMHSRDLIGSPVWRALGLFERRMLDVLELEHLSHGGTKNGDLAVSFTTFERASIRRQSIPKCLRTLEALMLVEVVKRGFRGSPGFSQPHKYRLTYLGHAKGSRLGRLPTNEWQRLTTDDDVVAALKAAGVDRPKKQMPERRKPPAPLDIEERVVSAPNRPLTDGVVSAPNKAAA